MYTLFAFACLCFKAEREWENKKRIESEAKRAARQAEIAEETRELLADAE